MRHKPLPPPPDDLTTLHDARTAVPLVPGSEEDCCVRLQGRLDLPSRDVAATWLGFLQALGLASEGQTGFSRGRELPDDATLAQDFLSNVYGAREVHERLARTTAPLEPATVAEQTEDLMTGWERRKHGAEWPAVWRARTTRLLDWLVLFGLAAHTDPGYTAADTD